MNKKLFLLSILISSIIIFSFSLGDNRSAAQKTRSYIVTEATKISEQFDFLIEALNNKNTEVAKAEYLKLRTHFKHIDFYIAYLDPQGFDKKINESPLMKPEPKVANKSPKAPGGMQMIDENLFSDDINFNQLITWSKLTKQHIKQLITIHVVQQPLYDAIFIQSLKEGLIRSLTLSITGFETPGTANIEADLNAFKESLNKWHEIYSNEIPTNLSEEFRGIISKINPSTFEDFDRYSYLVEVINPLLENLEKIRIAINAELPNDLNAKPLVYNSTVTNVFDKNFLNARVLVEAGETEYLNERIALGKKLFEDKGLSNSKRISCQTCHQKDKAFSDQLQFADSGDLKSKLDRNSPSINYSAYSEKFFWDLRAHDLKNQTEHVVYSEKEFNATNEKIVEYLKTKDEYTQLFKEAFPEYPDPIHKATFSLALKEYVASLPEHKSDFDKYVQNNETEIPQDIKQGFNLFMGKAQCATCHFPPTFSGLVPPKYEESESEVIGVLVNNNFDNPVLDNDLGRKQSKIVKDDYEFFTRSFKTPTIRNVEHSFPYMHNGSLKTLEEVMNFYNKGGGAGMGLELDNQTLPFDSLELSDEEQKQIISFMKSLTDEYLIN